MTTVSGIVRDGKIVADAPAGLPDGGEVMILIDNPASERELTPDEVEGLIAEYESYVGDPVMSPEESAAFERLLAEDKARELAGWDDYSKGIEQLSP